MLASLTLFIFSIYITDKYQNPVTIFKKGVVVGNLDLSGKDWHAGMEMLEETLNRSVYLNFEAKSKAVQLKDMGITVDRDRLSRYTKVCKYKTPPIFCQPTSNEPVSSLELIKVDTELMNSFLGELENEVQFIKNSTIISFDDYSFRTLSPSAKVTIDKEPFQSLQGLGSLITQKENIKIALDVTTKDDNQLQKEQTEFLAKSISKPLLIKYGRTPLYIPSVIIEGFIETREKEGFLYGYMVEENVAAYLNELKDKYGSDEVKVLEKEAVKAIQRALLYRAANTQINNAVILPLEGIPRTNGELHSVYLEVIKPQQRLYRFENGELVKTYIISTGLTYDTPAGKFEVQGKQKMTISYYHDWYMPNYLPIGTIDGVHKFGFHSIPYHLDANGNIYSRDENTMGSPATGGCIQLQWEDSLELFDWAQIGTPVYIYD